MACHLLFGNQQLPGLRALEVADNAAFFHLIHDARSSRVTELQPALEHGNGGLPGLRITSTAAGSISSPPSSALSTDTFDADVSLAALSALGGLLINFGHDLVGIFPPYSSA